MSAAGAPVAFTYRRARSGALTAGLSLAVAVETVVVHLWLAPRHAGWAWTLTALSLASLVYLAADYRAWGRHAVRVDVQAVELRVGLGTPIVVPRAAVVAAAPATWRDLPDGHDPAYLNATAPAEPNVLLTLAPPVPMRPAAVLPSRPIARLGLHLDDPDGFVRAVTVERPVG